MRRYAVIGDPIEHSLSPTIHAAFARQLGIDLLYDRIRVSTDSFSDAVNEFFASGGSGLNVTSPLKSLAFEYADLVSDPAMNAGTANTLKFLDTDVVYADNTDGAGLVEDLRLLDVPLSGQRVLVIGAGGAARGCVGALLAENPAALFIHNRTEARARRLIEDTARFGNMQLLSEVDGKQPFDVVINATSASLSGARPDIDAALFRDAVCYDMAYGDSARPFIKWALAQGARAAYDGLGMLIEQAAVSFLLWHEVRPDTGPVRRRLLDARTPAR